MKSFAAYLFVVIIYLSVRSTLLVNIPSPDLSLIIVFYIASQKASFEGPVFSFILGYCEDVFSGGIIGMTSLCLVVVFVAARLLYRRVELDTPLTKILGVGLMSFVKGIVSYLVVYLINRNVPLVFPILSTLLVTGLLAPPLLLMIEKIHLFIIMREREGRVV